MLNGRVVFSFSVFYNHKNLEDNVDFCLKRLAVLNVRNILNLKITDLLKKRNRKLIEKKESGISRRNIC